MPRKSKSTSSEKKFSTVPPKAAMPASTVAKAIEPVTTAANPPVTPAVKPVVEAKAPAALPSIEPMVGALRSFDADIAREAATALGKTGNPAAVLPLIDVVRNTNGYFHSVVRSAAAAGLGQLKDSRAFDVLIDAVNDPITDPSTEAIHALAALGDRKAVAKLIEVIHNGNGFYAGSVRHAAVAALIKLGGEAATTELHRVAANPGEEPAIRELAGASGKIAGV